MAKVTMNQVRSVEWGKSFNWDIQFFGENSPPSPFDTWFPAIDVEENIANIETFQVGDAFMNSYEIPSGTSPRTLRITFQDNAEHVLLGWMEEWINLFILNERKYMSVLETAVRSVTVRKITGKGESINNNDSRNVTMRNYFVFPKDSISYTGNSSSDSLTYSITFAIAGVSGEFK